MNHAIGYVTVVGLPSMTSIATLYESTNLADAYAVHLRGDVTASPEQLARFIFGNLAPWVNGLMSIRDAIVTLFGLKTVRQLRRRAASGADSRVGPFKIYESNDREIVMGEDDKHLDFRLSVLYTRGSNATKPPRLVLSTVVHCHNRLGRTYLFIIAPFHRLIARRTLRRAARTGWPRADTATN